VAGDILIVLSNLKCICIDRSRLEITTASEV
jgi:hypothetical protein